MCAFSNSPSLRCIFPPHSRITPKYWIDITKKFRQMVGADNRQILDAELNKVINAYQVLMDVE